MICAGKDNTEKRDDDHFNTVEGISLKWQGHLFNAFVHTLFRGTNNHGHKEKVHYFIRFG